jgi:hypothetical protein
LSSLQIKFHPVFPALKTRIYFYPAIPASKQKKVVATTGVLLSAVEFFTRRLEQLVFCSVIHFLI